MPIVPMFGTGVKGWSANATSQRRLNLYVDGPQGRSVDKSDFVLYPRPGLVAFTSNEVTGGTIDFPMTGLISVGHSAGLLFVSSGSYGDYAYCATNGRSFELRPTKTVWAEGTGGYATNNPTVFAYGGTTTLAADGNYVFWPQNGSLTALSIANAPTLARSVCFVGGRFVVDDQANPGQFRWSGLDVTSPGTLTWDPLDFATAESAPDALVRVFAHRGELLLFGSETLEFWAPSGDQNIFTRINGATAPWGLSAFDTVGVYNGSLLFLGASRSARAQVVMLDGYSPQVISTPDVEKSINDELAANATPDACVISNAGHSWYVLSLINTSWAYDLTNSSWCEWQTDGKRWAGKYSAIYDGKCLVTDYRNANVYYLDENTYTDNGNAIVREVTSRHVFNDLERMTLDQVTIDVEAGTGLTTGQGSDPQIMLQISRDGGHTYGNEMWSGLGKRGYYGWRAVWNRLGRARDWVFRWRITDAVKVVILNASAKFRG